MSVDVLAPVLIVFILGSAVGSFLNVVVYRLPAGLSLLHPPSRCPMCKRRLKLYDNVPVFGWLWLKGRCRSCRQSIAVRYPIVEFCTGGLFVAVFLAFGMNWPTPGGWIFIGWLLALALIDLDTMTLPNSLTASGLVLGWLFQGGASYLEMATVAHLLAGITTSIMASVLALWLFELVGVIGSRALGKAAMGGGDAKLAAMMAAWLGFTGMLLATFLAATIGAVAGGCALALGTLGPRQHIPFGPYLALGAVLTLFYGNWLMGIYMNVFFPAEIY